MGLVPMLPGSACGSKVSKKPELAGEGAWSNGLEVTKIFRVHREDE